MPVSVEQLAEYVNASPLEPTLPGILIEATTLIDEYLKAPGRQNCPPVVYDLATKQLGSELWTRRNSPGGVSQFGPDGAPVRLARDPLVAVKPLLAPFRGLGKVA